MVSVTPRFERVKIVMPSSCSRSLIAVERFDCETYMFWAAALIDPCSEMAMRYLSCCNVIDCFLFSVVKTQYSILDMVLDY